MYAERSEDVIWLWTELHEAELVRQIPGSRWHRDHKKWWVPLSWAACISMRGIFGDDLEIGPDLTAWAEHELETRIGPCMELREAEDAEIPAEVLPPLPKVGDVVNGETVEEDWDLEPRQRAGILYLATAERALLGDGMGSGKTIQLIMTLQLLDFLGKDPYPAVIVSPNSMKETWRQELERWAPGRSVMVVEGGAAKRRKQLAEEGVDVFVLNWEQLRFHSRCAGYGTIKLTDKEKEPKELNALEYHSFIADEAHRAKNPKSQQTRAAWAVSWKAKYRFGATGTPLSRTPEDMWSIMRMIEPTEWPSKTKFIDRYGLQSWSNFGFMDVVGIKGETREELFRFLDPRFIRRPTQIVVPALRPKLPPQIRRVELPAKQRKAYDQMAKDLLAQLDTGVLMATNPLSQLTRLIQLAAAYGEIDEEGNMRLSEPSAKLDALDDVMEELGPEEPLVVFAESRQLIELASLRLQKQNITHGMIVGGMNAAHRQKSIDDFQAGDLRAVLVTLGAGGEGLTLTKARYSVFLQRSFSLIKNLQAEDRTWRKGQMREVQRIDIMAKDTIEDHILDVGFDREDKLQELCRDEETVKRWLLKKK